MSATEVDVAPVNEAPAAPPVIHEALPNGLDATFHLDEGLAQDDPDNYLVVHELLGRGQLLNAYEVSESIVRACNTDVFPRLRPALHVAPIWGVSLPTIRDRFFFFFFFLLISRYISFYFIACVWLLKILSFSRSSFFPPRTGEDGAPGEQPRPRDGGVFFVRGPFDVSRARASYFHIRVRVSALVRLIQERYGIDSKLTRHLPFFSFLFFSFSRSLFQQHEVEFGNGILNKGKKNVKREKRQPTQIEIMAAVEREKQAKKAERRAAKVRAHMRRPLCLFFYFIFWFYTQ